MLEPRIFNFSTANEIIDNAEKILESFKTDIVVCIRGANLSIEDQHLVAQKLGDVFSWAPNSSEPSGEQYVESHKRLENKESLSGDEVFLNWHMEHVEYDQTDFPIIAGIWNMLTFTTDSENGKTYFYDTANLYNNLSDKDKDFLSRCDCTWSDYLRENPYVSQVVQTHWLTGEKVIRLNLNERTTIPGNLYNFDNRKPTEDERNYFVGLRDFLVKTIQESTQDRIIHKWQQGDLLIPDLFKGAHAATGGFSSEQREFVGIWARPTNWTARVILES